MNLTIFNFIRYIRNCRAEIKTAKFAKYRSLYRCSKIISLIV
nr:MAG TPA: hypothetical protein [Bacteriophage sp.]